MALEDLRQQLAAAASAELADELLDAYQEMRSRHFRRDFRPSQLEAGRFAEAAFRVLQLIAKGSYTSVGKTLPKLPDLLSELESADPKAVHESIRLHIPRALAAVYNVRNRRDVGHIAADVDANSMDAEYLIATCNWVLAELTRLLHQCSPEEAEHYIAAIVEREAPLVQVFGEDPFVNVPDLSNKEELLLLLYHKEGTGATLDDLDHWTPRTLSRQVISARLSELENSERHIRRDSDGRAHITNPGAKKVETILRERTS